MSLSETARILGQLAPALDLAHSKVLVHRDLKPANIFFDSLSNSYPSDFGIVKITEGTSILTGTGIISTPANMSPEQVAGEKDLTANTADEPLPASIDDQRRTDLQDLEETPTKVLNGWVAELVSPAILDESELARLGAIRPRWRLGRGFAMVAGIGVRAVTGVLIELNLFGGSGTLPEQTGTAASPPERLRSKNLFRPPASPRNPPALPLRPRCPDRHIPT